ncbi:WecB/TagA/CpsF family glycosyltransferase [Parvibium lacunae]|uniref:Glycosyltransferase n=1 Tax=Parvibium lacunae TaxID=1888893 RepID=A0A368KZV4_9BURK|nr:WecB/TagA/CpsF family glycosyltransferase [Parvibium lacunae]RCS56672.1 glycosyltransferase [Parvibium lacunae]
MTLATITKPPRVRILNSEFDPLTLPATVTQIFADIQAGQRGWLCTVNVAILMMMRSSAPLQRFVAQARLIVADGQPLVWFAPVFGARLPERVTGVDLIDALCARAAEEKIGLYLLGASNAVIQTVAERLRHSYPGLVVDAADGYFQADAAPQRAAAIKASGAKILLVGMGVPRQEQFIEQQWENLGATVAIGVGGSFDVLAGLRQRAPGWVQRIGMEWFYRLIQEPRRLFMRYLVTNSQFLALVLRALLTGKRY